MAELPPPVTDLTAPKQMSRHIFAVLALLALGAAVGLWYLFNQTKVENLKLGAGIELKYRVGTVDFNRLATLETNLVQQQDLEAQARGQIDLGLVQVYRSLGGGWDYRLSQDAAAGGQAQAAAPLAPMPPEKMPVPPANPDLNAAPLPPPRPTQK